MRKIYYRPSGLVYGPDARDVIAQGRGASLSGLSSIAYTLVEVIERDGPEVRRRLVSYAEAAQDSPPTWRGEGTPNRSLAPFKTHPDTNRPLIMGIVNVTPDSFSDGGRNAATDQAIAHGIELARQGADILDVGGESTRPGSDPVPVEEELRRVLPVISALAAEGLSVSCDTRKARVMREALNAGPGSSTMSRP